MKRGIVSILAALMGAVGAFAMPALADTLRVNVTVEVVMPDSTRTTRSVQTAVPASSSGVVVAPVVELTPVEIPVAVEECEIPVHADTVAVASHITEAVTAVADSIAPDSIPTLLPVPTPYIKPPKPDPVRVRFAWGAELASSIDLSGHDMSSIDFNAYFGLRYKWLSLAGVGAGVDIMVSNSCRTYPLFAVFRTDFSKYVKIAFLDVRGGVALNYLPNNVSQTAPYASASVGFNLARSPKFRSYILVGYTFVGRKDVVTEDRTVDYPSLSMASIRLGVAF